MGAFPQRRPGARSPGATTHDSTRAGRKMHREGMTIPKFARSPLSRVAEIASRSLSSPAKGPTRWLAMTWIVSLQDNDVIARRAQRDEAISGPRWAAAIWQNNPKQPFLPPTGMTDQPCRNTKKKTPHEKPPAMTTRRRFVQMSAAAFA